MKSNRSKLIFSLIISFFAFYIFNRSAGLYQSFLNLDENFLSKILLTIDKLPNEIKINFFKIYLDKYSIISGIIGIMIISLIYLYNTFGRNNYLVGTEHGSAKWGTEKDIKPFIDKIEEKNIILTKTEGLSLDTRNTLRNNNVLVIGGSGSGKTRFFVKPNLMQKHTSYVITDPKGSLIKETGKMLEDAGYKIKIFNLIDMDKSDKYNFFSYLRDEKDVLKLVNNLITNTNSPYSKTSGDFWEKAETALLQALFSYILFETREEDKHIGSVMELLRLAEVREDNEDFKSPLDLLFEDLKEENPNNFASKQYDLFKLGAGKTSKSILVSVGVRLSAFNIPAVTELLSEDTLEMDTLGDEKTALFVILPDTDKTFNFISAIMYQQLFDTLFLKAEKEYGGRLPFHVRFLLDEFANIGQIPNFETYIATMRSREVSVSVILQNIAQLKSLYKDTWETITGNCDTLLFLGGKEQSTLEYISKMIGKTTIDLRTTNQSKGQTGSFSINEQVLGRELITSSEVGLLKTDECILSIRGVEPFLSKKYDITKHKNYKELSDYDEKNIYRIKDPLIRKSENFFRDVKEVEIIGEI
ncbi:VirD4-like conjugal transfer protein, CD1115 family [Tissierella pigra]|uniref:Type IV secretory system conjugative DNA transfer family protein n=1 Tax=Tissierella pigra TaxID=2607614 RepID=A0A6N7XJ89_9FIRM|nr:type IV secretory system conjugative DNA transfer family protein [Tissierella pigra]MSU02151.1 type IV secretory system conjugative DNA transfer family protein [Tissierella pigra]